MMIKCRCLKKGYFWSRDATLVVVTTHKYIMNGNTYISYILWSFDIYVSGLKIIILSIVISF
jgi:hypothetical protein